MNDLTLGSVNPMDRVEEALAALRSGGRLDVDAVTRPHALIVAAWRSVASQRGRAKENLLTLFAPGSVWESARELLLGAAARRLATQTGAAAAGIVLIGRVNEGSLGDAAGHGVVSALREDATDDELQLATQNAFDLLEAKGRAEARGQWLRRYRFELGELIHIARAMTTVRDVGELLGLILEKGRFVTGADAGSIYVVESNDTRPMLRFKLTQNDSVSFDSREFTVPVSDRSIAGCAALRKTTLNLHDVYDLPAGTTFHFDPSFDQRTGYLTRSMLVAPLVSQRDEVIGVIQLINKKRDPGQKLATRADVEAQVVPFDERSEELLGLLASQAGVSLETAMLYDEITRLFEGFVKASVEAIESRDPTTSGHSRRVAELTVELAKIVDAEALGPYASARFSAEDLRELEYASLLHDFGKIGVREKVLVKAKKLYDEQLGVIRARFDYAARSIEADVLARKVGLFEAGAGGDGQAIEALDRELLRRRTELEEWWTAICCANEPTLLSAGDFERVDAIARETFRDARGDVRTLLDEAEVASLKVTKGSLTPTEFDEIRSHVSHTFRFLSQIPWGKSLRRVPVIAGSHHEWLNGTGYPHRLRAEEIPVQSKMMSIADVYDALTASDRPYKKAAPIERALDILGYAVRDGHLDGELVRIFKEARVWERALPPGVRGR